MKVRKPLKLDQLGYVGRGRSRHRPRNDPSLYGGPYPFFQTGDVAKANFYLSDHSQTYNEKGLAQSKMWEPGTLCITISANIADTAVLKIKGCFPDSIVGFIADREKSDVSFIKYYIDSIKISMQNVSRGTTQDNLSLDKLLTFDFHVPEVKEQRQIASVLLAYDDLIENNTRRIAILEEMARRLYEEWFVHFRFPGHESAKFVKGVNFEIPEGWSLATLDSIASINPVTITSRSAPKDIHYIDIASVSPGKINYSPQMPFKDAPSRARRQVAHGDMLWSCVRPNRKSYALVLNPLQDTIASTGFAVIRSTSVPFSYTYCALQTDGFVAYLVNRATGAAYPAVNQSDFSTAPILRPSVDILNLFDNHVEPVLNLANSLNTKNANLRAQRDLLLPKLISGEIDVSKAKDLMEETAA